MLNTVTAAHAKLASDRLGKVIAGATQEIGGGFTARHFSEDLFRGLMDPLLMVDHFVMTAPTFPPHLHAGLSAVTVMFEDSQGEFLNRDTLGHTLSLRAGDLYWLAAGNGAAHEEKPANGAHVHALQVFVNLPGRLKMEPARALHVQAPDVPIITDQSRRVRVVLGRTGDVIGATGTPEEMTLLDGVLQPGGSFIHPLPTQRQAWIYAVTGTLSVRVNGARRTVQAGCATTVSAGSETDILLESSELTHFVLLAAPPIREPFVKAGPLVMCTAEDVRQTLANYATGKFGPIAE